MSRSDCDNPALELEIEVQSQLDDAVGKRRRAADGSEASATLTTCNVNRMEAGSRIGIGFRELRMIRQIEQIR